MPTSRQALYVFFVASLIASLAVSLCTAGNAADLMDLPQSADETSPLSAGDQAPEFVVRTVDGEPYFFDPDKLQRPLVLISFRGGWCPYCNMHLSELRTVIPTIREMGFDVLFLSNDRPDQLYNGLKRETQEDLDGLDYVILSDADLQAARAFGTAFKVPSSLYDYLADKDRDYDDSSIDRFDALGVPFVYLVDESGQIVFDYVEPNHRIRLSAEALLAAAHSAAN